MKKEVKIFKLIQLSDSAENINWYQAIISLTVNEHELGGNSILMDGGYRHKLFWMKEFELSESEFNSLVKKNKLS